MSSIKSNNRHSYLQIIDRIKQDIEDGLYKEREKLPSEFELANQLGVSRAALREALRVLEEENVVIHRHGVGIFVNTKPLFNTGIEQLNSVTRMIKQAGMVPGTIFLSTDTQGFTEEDAERFSCSMDDEVVVIERVRTANGEPVAYCIDKVPKNKFPEAFTHEHESIYEFLETAHHKKIMYAVADIEPIGYHEKISPILECNPETTLLVLKQMHYNEDEEPILYSVNYFRSDRFRFHVLRKRVNN